MTHQLTVYGKDLRVIVQMKGLSEKAASEVRAHFEKTVSQAILDAPHIGVMKEHQLSEFSHVFERPVDDVSPKGAAREAGIARAVAAVAPNPERAQPAAVKTRPDASSTPVDRAGRPLKAKKAKKRG